MFDSTAVDAIANLADTDVDERTVVDGLPEDLTESVRVIRRRDDETLETVDLERHLDRPRRARGGAVIHDPASFAAYVNRVRTSRTTVWADQSTSTVTAVVNDAAESDGDTPAEHGWRDHTVTLELQVDPAWSAWAAHDGKLLAQEIIAEHFDAYALNVVRPDAATMLEVASSIRGTKTAEFESTRRDRTGDIVVRYSETTGAKAGQRDELEVPERFTVSIAPYVGFDPVELEAVFRLRIDGGRLTVGYRLIRPDLVLRDAFAHVRGVIDEQIDDAVPVYLGAAPAAVTSSNAGR